MDGHPRILGVSFKMTYFEGQKIVQAGIVAKISV